MYLDAHTSKHLEAHISKKSCVNTKLHEKYRIGKESHQRDVLFI